MTKQRSFIVDEKQLEKFRAWDKAHVAEKHTSKRDGSIGGRITWSFTGTSLGQVTKVTCACGEMLDLSYYEEW